MKTKWLKKRIAVFMTAALSVSTFSGTVFAAGDYASAEKEAWANSVKNFASAYASSLEQYDAVLAGTDTKITLSLDEAGRSLLGFLAPFDVSWADSVSATMKTTFKDGKEGILMTLLLNGSQICTLEYYLDPDTQDAYMRIPELSDKFFKVNLQEAMQEQETEDMVSAYAGSMNVSLSMLSDYAALLPEASVVEELLNKYAAFVFDNVTEGESAAETLTVGDVSEDCTVYEAQISAQDAIRMGTDILESARSDEEIQKLLKMWGESFSDSDDLYEQFSLAVEGGLSSLQEIEISEEDTETITTKIWVSEDGTIAGRELSDPEGIPVLTWKMPQADAQFGYELSITDPDDAENSYKLSGNGTIENDFLNGDYQISVGDIPYANIEVTDYDTVSAKNGEINGHYVISVIAPEENETMASLQNFGLVMDLTSAGTSGTIELSVTSAQSILATLGIAAEPGEEIEIPDLDVIGEVYDTANEEDMNTFAAELDLTTIMENIMAAGVPEEVINYVLTGGASAEDEADLDLTVE